MNEIKNLTYPNIAVNTHSGVVFLKTTDILYCKAEGNYTHLYYSEGEEKKIIIAKPLKKVLDLLQSDFFFRIHNSFFINLLHISCYNNGEKNCVTLTNGTVLAVSRSRKDEFLKKFQMI